MEHGRYVEKFRVKGQTLAFSCQGSRIVNAHGMLKQQVAFGMANDLSCVARQFALGNSYPESSSIAFGIASSTLGVTRFGA